LDSQSTPMVTGSPAAIAVLISSTVVAQRFAATPAPASGLPSAASVM
jgi:hypothetical protein